MPETYTGENQATEGGGSKFAGVRADTGAASEFLAIAGDEVVTEHGKRVAAMRTNQPSTIGMGYATGTREDAAASSDDGTFSLISLFKRGMLHWAAVRDGVGDPDDAAVTPGFAGSVTGKLRQLSSDVADTLFLVGATDDPVVGWVNDGTLLSRLRSVAKAIGDYNDTAVTAGNVGTIGARIRQISLDIANRLPASVDRKAAAASFPAVLSTEDFAAIGATNETAPASDTATSGANGRLQRIAQNQTKNSPRGATGASSTVAITATATLIKGANVNRKNLHVRNSSASSGAIWLGYTSGVTAGTAGANIEVMYPGDSVDFDDWTGDVYGICDTGLTASAKYGESAT